MATRNLTIMFTDIKGFTERVSDGSRKALSSLRSLHDRLLIPVFNHFEGNIVKTIGDAFLVYFNSPTDAVMCGITIQEVLRQHNAFAPEEERLEVRVAINSGEVDVSENDVMGEPVNIAARLEGIAEAGEVYFTEAVYLSMNRNEAPSAEIGERSFKGIPYPVKIYRTILEPETELAKRLSESIKITDQGSIIRGLHTTGNHKGRGRLFTVALIIVLLIATLVAYLVIPDKYERGYTKADIAIKNNQPAAALEIINPLLRLMPDHQRLNRLALDAATKHIDNLRSNQSSKTALNWLSANIETAPYLEALRHRIPILDAISVSEQVIENKKDSDWCTKELKGLLQRYPDNPEVPYKAATLLKGKVFMGFPLWLYGEALNRGTEPDLQIFEFCTGLFDSNFPGWVEKAHSIIESHYPEKGLLWAVNVMDTDISGNHIIYGNAWYILRKSGDPRTEHPYFISFMNLVHGYTQSGKTADKSIRIFLDQPDDFRKKQVLALARNRVNYRSGRMKDVERTLKVLEEQWKDLN